MLVAGNWSMYNMSGLPTWVNSTAASEVSNSQLYLLLLHILQQCKAPVPCTLHDTERDSIGQLHDAIVKLETEVLEERKWRLVAEESLLKERKRCGSENVKCVEAWQALARDAAHLLTVEKDLQQERTNTVRLLRHLETKASEVADLERKLQAVQEGGNDPRPQRDPDKEKEDLYDKPEALRSEKVTLRHSMKMKDRKHTKDEEGVPDMRSKLQHLQTTVERQKLKILQLESKLAKDEGKHVQKSSKDERQELPAVAKEGKDVEFVEPHKRRYERLLEEEQQKSAGLLAHLDKLRDEIAEARKSLEEERRFGLYQDVNCRGYGGRTALHRAAGVGDIAAMEELLSRGADLNIRDAEWGETPLMLTATPEKAKRWLVEHGADLEVANRDGFNVLHYAAYNGMVDRAAFLLDKGARVNAKAHRNQTPLHLAALAGHMDVVRLLLDRSADITATDSAGHTAEYMARESGHKHIANLLETLSLYNNKTHDDSLAKEKED